MRGARTDARIRDAGIHFRHPFGVWGVIFILVKGSVSMRYKRILSCLLALCCVISVPASISAQESVTVAPEAGRLVIASSDNSTISIERLIYIALKRIKYNVDFVYPIIREGYSTADEGTNDGVVAAYPGLDSVYTNLIKVPVPLEHINVNVFTREGSDLNIKSWGDLSGLRVGILDNRTYILDKLPQNANITVKDTNTAVLNGLADGEYDVAVLAERSHALTLKKYIIPAGLY